MQSREIEEMRLTSPFVPPRPHESTEQSTSVVSATDDADARPSMSHRSANRVIWAETRAGFMLQGISSCAVSRKFTSSLATGPTWLGLALDRILKNEPNSQHLHQMLSFKSWRALTGHNPAERVPLLPPVLSCLTSIWACAFLCVMPIVYFLLVRKNALVFWWTELCCSKFDSWARWQEIGHLVRGQ